MIVQPILPWYLLLIILVVAAIFTGWRIFSKPISNRRAWLQRFCVILLIITACFRPAIPGEAKEWGAPLVDVYVVMDTTMSSAAEDYDNGQPRINGMRRDAKEIAKKLVGARFSLITFNNKTFVNSPLSTDVRMFESAVDTVNIISEGYATGSSIDAPIDTIASEITRTKHKNPERTSLLFYLGDGEQTSDASPKSFASLRPLPGGGAIMGYGTAAGGKMKTPSYSGGFDGFYLRGPDLKYAVSKIDETNLKNIASQTGLPYTHRQTPDSIDTVVKNGSVDKAVNSSRSFDGYNDIYWIAIFAAAILLAFEMRTIYLPLRKLQNIMPSEGENRE